MQRKTVKEKRDGSSYGGGPRLSVYDEGQDTTDRATAEQKGEVRWKYDGPWLDGMQEGDFQRWMIREVGKRHGEWKEYLCNMEVERKINAARMNARHEGESLSEADIDRLRVTAQPTDQEFAVLQKRLRDGHERDQLSSDLTALITNFLDLPSLFAKEGGDEFARMMSSLIGSNANGAPSTHPGAGLSHLRTNAIMENHPIHGPQAFRTPVEARVLRPRGGDNTAKEYSATLGVAGMAAEDAISGSYKPEDRSKYRPSDDPAANLDPESETGGKVWVRPQRAWIDDQGRVRMALVRADDEAVKVKLGDVEDIHASKNGPSRKPQNSYVGQSAGANYGTALPRSAPSAARSGVQGFDEELSSSVGSSARQQLENLLPRARAR